MELPRAEEAVVPQNKIEELDSVTLNDGLPEYGLTTGDVGTVVHIYKGGHGYMVEFATFD